MNRSVMEGTSVKRFERSNGLHTALCKKKLYLFLLLRSSCNGMLLKVTRKTIAQSSFTLAGSQRWNDLPINVRA